MGAWKLIAQGGAMAVLLSILLSGLTLVFLIAVVTLWGLAFYSQTVLTVTVLAALLVTLIPTLVPREHLPNALSLNIIVWQMASIGGPMLGGLLIAALGIAPVYLIDSLSFFGVIVAWVLFGWIEDLAAKRPPEWWPGR